MKLKHTLLALGLIATSLTTAYSQDDDSSPEWGAAAKVTLSLTQTWTIPTLYKRDESGLFELDEAGKKILTSTNSYTIESVDKDDNPTKTVATNEVGTKRITKRYGNRELLIELLNEGALGEDVTSIKGWSIVAFYGGISFDGASNEPATPVFYARHTNKSMVLIAGLSATRSNLMDTTSMKIISTTTYKDEDETTKTSRSYSRAYRGQAALILPGVNNLAGVITGKESYSTKKYTYYEEDEETEKLIKRTGTSHLRLPGSAKLDKLVGTQSYENGTALVEGSLSISAGSIVDAYDYIGDDDGGGDDDL